MSTHAYPRVIEITVTFVAGQTSQPELGSISERFQQAIREQLDKGYFLDSWQFSTAVEPHVLGINPTAVSETIIAVFRSI